MDQTDKPAKLNTCTDCGGTKLVRDYETGELICQSCGTVIASASIDQSPEWRAFDYGEMESRSRVGAPSNLLIHDNGLSTNIGWQNRDSTGRKLGPEMMSKIYRLRKWHIRSKVSDSINRNLSFALNEMNRIGSSLNLPKNVIETSSMNYRRALNANLVRGRTIQTMVAASMYLACRQCGVTRTLEDVAYVIGVSKKEAARNYRFLLQVLKPSVPPVDPRGYISKIVNNLELSGETERLASQILDQVSGLKLTVGRGPRGMAAACIYISSRFTKDTKTQGDIAREAQVTEVTVRNRYKELVTCLDFEILL